MTKKLAQYTAKRDFRRTEEPTGTGLVSDAPVALLAAPGLTGGRVTGWAICVHDGEAFCPGLRANAWRTPS